MDLQPMAIGGQRALLIGINKYPFFPPENQLRGCLNDVALVKDFLIGAWSFPPGCIRELLDENAGAAAIRRELEALANEAPAGGRVVIYFSGHGSRRPDARPAGPDGPPAQRAGDEQDGWDETLVPHDSGRHPHPSRDLVDDEIHDYLARILARGPWLHFIVDACRSGTVFRDEIADGMRIRQAPADTTRAAERQERPQAEAQLLFCSGRLTTLSACADHQGAFEMEIGGRYHGAFTHHLVRSLAQLAPGASFAALRERTLLRLRCAFSNQWPRFEGAVTSPLPARHPSYRPPAAPEVADFAKRTLRIVLPEEDSGPVRRALAASPWLAEAPAGRPSWAMLEKLASGRPEIVFPAGGSPRYLVARKGGEPILLAESLDPEVMVEALERRARQAHLLGLDDDHPDATLQAGLELSLWRRDPEGCWLPAETDDGLPSYRDGERLGLKIEHRGPRPVYLGVFLLGADGSIALLYPASGSDARLEPGSSLEIGMGFRVRIVLRAHLPAWRTPPPQGDVEQVKVFAASSPWDWPSWLIDSAGGPLPPPTAGTFGSISSTIQLKGG